MAAAFCTCRDKKCPLNPANHDKGCTPCVAKCLQDGELPSCFFNAVTPYRGPDADYSYLGFARVMLGAEEAQAAHLEEQQAAQSEHAPEKLPVVAPNA